MVLLATVWPRFETAPRIRVYPHGGFSLAFEDSVLLEQIDDNGLLVALDPTSTATVNNVKGWIGVLMTEDSSLPWRTKRRRVYPKRPG